MKTTSGCDIMMTYSVKSGSNYNLATANQNPLVCIPNQHEKCNRLMMVFRRSRIAQWRKCVSDNYVLIGSCYKIIGIIIKYK